MSSQGRGWFHLLLLVLLAFTIHPSAVGEDWPAITPEELSMTNLAEQPGAAAVVLLRDELADDPHNDRTVYVRIKVLTEPGRSYADVEIPYSRRDFNIWGGEWANRSPRRHNRAFHWKALRQSHHEEFGARKGATVPGEVVHPSRCAGRKYRGISLPPEL
jgi:hypothetical protein